MNEKAKMTNLPKVLSADDYREFLSKVQILEHKGYELPYEVDFGTVENEPSMKVYRVKVLGEHDPRELDRLTNEYLDSQSSNENI